jgi:HAD superfamily hydrolase (TIGR01509 family)
VNPDHRFRTALFDVDGTLIDSNDAHVQSWVESLREHGIPVEAEQIRPLIGMGGDKLLPAIAQVRESSALGRAVARRKREIFKVRLPALQATPGARALLEHLRDQRVTIGIATSAGEEELDALLRQAGVDDLVHRRTSKDDAAESKPAPDIVHAALEECGARPESTIMIGDTPYDIQAANQAEVGVIALRCGGYWSDHDLKDALAIFDDPLALLAHWCDQTAVGTRARAPGASGGGFHLP